MATKLHKYSETWQTQKIMCPDDKAAERRYENVKENLF